MDVARLPVTRASAQLLHRPAGISHPADVAREICGAQAQEPIAGRLAFRARHGRITAVDVDRARTDERSLVRTWAMRSTMHLLAADDVRWLVPLFEEAMNANSLKRLPELGLQPSTVERALREIRHALESDGPLDRDELTRRLASKGIELDVRTRMHLYRLAVTRGIACLGPDLDGRTCLVLARDWLGKRPPHDRDAALRELALRYLGAFGPAVEADFAGWAGLGLRDVRAGLAAIASEIEQVKLADTIGWRLKGRRRSARRRIVRLLPGWDTYLMGYRDRAFMASEKRWRRVMPGGGILHPSLVVDGVLAGTWNAKRAKGSMTVRVEMFSKPERAIKEAIQAEVADLGRFEGRAATLA